MAVFGIKCLFLQWVVENQDFFKSPLADCPKHWHIMPAMNTPNESNFPADPTFDFVVGRLKTVLLDQILEAIEQGTLHVPEYIKCFGESAIDYALAPNLVRHVAKKYLIGVGQAAKGEEEADAAGFEPEDIPNNGLCINTPGFVVRVLKSSEDGSVPRPGISEARKNYYRHNQGILNFENDSNDRPQPTYHLVVHWTVDRDYNLQKVSIALPYDVKRNETGRWDVFCLFDEPFWTRPPQSNVTPITAAPVEPIADNDLNVQAEAEEKTGEESEDK